MIPLTALQSPLDSWLTVYLSLSFTHPSIKKYTYTHFHTRK